MALSKIARRVAVLLAACGLAAGAAGAASARQPFDHAGLARIALERHIRPGYAQLKEATDDLGRTLRACPATSFATRKRLADAFEGLVTAWGRIEHIQFGPIAQQNRLERILFFPDRRGLGARQIAKVLADRDPRVLDAGQLAKRSIALQGIGTLEVVLYGDRAAFRDAEQAVHRCGFARAIAANLASIVEELVTAWGKDGVFARHWLQPGAGNPVYLKPSETTLTLAKAYDQGLERVRDMRLGGPLGLNAERRRLPIVLAASDHSMKLTVANIEGLFAFYTRGGMQSAIVATNVTDADVSVPANARLIERELATARDEARRLARVARPFGRPESRDRIIAMGYPLKNARVQAAALLTLTAGLTMGFNSSDGD